MMYQHLHDHLHSVANAEDGNFVLDAIVEESGWDSGRALDVDRVGAAREDDSLGLVLQDTLLWGGKAKPPEKGTKGG